MLVSATEMLQKAKAGHYAVGQFNINNLEWTKAILQTAQELQSPVILGVSEGAGKYMCGYKTIVGMVNGMLGELGITVPVALHLDHGSFEGAKACINAGFSSVMFDGSHYSIEENIEKTKVLVNTCDVLGLSLEAEVGSIGGEEDGVTGEAGAKLYTTPEDMLLVENELSGIGRYTLAATFGNVHGVYKPGNVKLRPKVLKEGQDAIKAEKGPDAHFNFVFHGGSGSTHEEIQETLQYGVIKMNIDTDTQYAFSRPVADHVFKNYDGILKIDGEVGVKKVYDPRSYLKKGSAGVSARVVEACKDLNSFGKSIY